MLVCRVGLDPEESGCLILVDLDNMEASASAFVLLGLIQKKVIAGVQGSVPHVLMKLGNCFTGSTQVQELLTSFDLCLSWKYLISCFECADTNTKREFPLFSSGAAQRKGNKVPPTVQSVLLICSDLVREVSAVGSGLCANCDQL